MEIERKIKKEMRKLGCNSDMKIALAFQLYIHLVDEKLMYDTEYCYNKDIDTLYVVARKSMTERMNIYVPIPTHEKINVDYINIIQENLCTVETGPSVNLAIVDGDFTTAIYTFTRGLVGKHSRINAERKKKEERRNFINNQLQRSQLQILSEAFDGGFVEDYVCVID